MKVAIIGGSGKMGQWFAGFLSKEGKQAVISGRNEDKLLEAGQQLGVEVASNNVEAVKSADAVILSVPLESFEEVVEQISPHVKPGQIVVDITSTKILPVAMMQKHLKKASILGVHPLFGPGAKSISNQNFILTPTSEEESALAEKIRGYLEARGASVNMMTPREHDEKMTIILGLSHFIALVSADTLLSSGKMEQTEAFGGITYKVLLTLVESVISEDPALYASLQMGLPGIVEIEKLFREKAGVWADLVKKKDRQQFSQRMESLRESFQKVSPNFGKAYANMYKLVEGL